ncbi:hypothetical protein SNEBB_008123 [Seison nebaliae]|nr:hypothetical protein SNEBB_008123 [Seison nebaliae]
MIERAKVEKAKPNSILIQSVIDLVQYEPHINIDRILPPAPPDGGWGVAIAIAAFLCQFTIDGICYNLPALIIFYPKHFNCTQSQALIVGSVAYAMQFFAATIITSLVKRIGAQWVTLIGTLLLVLTTFIVPWLSTIRQVIIIQGCIFGLGGCATTLSAVIMPNYYFENHRAIVNAIVMTGSPSGIIIFSVMVPKLIIIFGWMGTHILLAGMAAQVAIAAATFVMVENAPQFNKKQSKKIDGEYSGMFHLPRKKNPPNYFKYDNTVITGGQSSTIPYRPQLRYEAKDASINEQETLRRVVELPSSLPIVVDDLHGIVSASIVNDPELRKEKKKLVINSIPSIIPAKEIEDVLHEQLARDPLNRTDIFYPHSLVNLKEFRSAYNIEQFRASMINLPNRIATNMNITNTSEIMQQLLGDNQKLYKKSISARFIETIKGLFNYRIFIDHQLFLIYCCFLVVNECGMYGTILLGYEYASKMEATSAQSSSLLLIFGGCSIISRLTVAGVINRCYNYKFLIVVIMNYLSAIATLSSGTFTEVLHVQIYFALLGVLNAPYASLIAVMIVDLVGLADMSDAVGIAYICRGIGSLTGSSIAAILLSIKDQPYHGLLFCGSAVCLGSTLLLSLYIIQKRQESDHAVNEVSSNYVKAELVTHILPPKPPDSGWSYVVLISSFFCLFLTDGMLNTIGIVVYKYIEYFQCSRTQGYLVASLLVGVSLLSGPVVAVIINKFGTRKVCCTGGIIMTLCLLFTAWCKSILSIIIIHGFFYGIGSGSVFLSACIMPSYYFEKYRAIASSFVGTGSGIGSLVMTIIIPILHDQYGWMATQVILAGLVLHIVACSMVFVPVEQNPLLRFHSPKEKMHLLIYYGLSMLSVFTGQKISKTIMEEGFASPSYRVIERNSDIVKSISDTIVDIHKAKSTTSLHDAKNFLRIPAELINSYLRIKPFDRDDIFYKNSLYNLPEFRNATDLDGFHKSVMHMEVDSETSLWSRCITFFKGKFITNISFILFCIGFALCDSGILIGMVFSYEFEKTSNITDGKTTSSHLIYLFASTTIARILLAVIANLLTPYIIIITLICNIVSGVICCLAPFYVTVGLMKMYLVILGSFSSAQAIFYGIITVQLVGLNNLTNGVGTVFFFQGISSLVAPVVGGSIYDSFKTNYSPIVFGGILILTGCLFYIYIIFRLYRNSFTHEEMPVPDT